MFAKPTFRASSGVMTCACVSRRCSSVRRLSGSASGARNTSKMTIMRPMLAAPVAPDKRVVHAGPRFNS